MPPERPIGIDLGTTFSAVAWVDEAGRTAMIRNAEGDLLTPSVVLFSDEETAVGKEARTATTVHPDLVAEWVKRDMGQPYYVRPIRGQNVPPEVIQSCILRKLKLDVAERPGPVQSGGHYRAGLLRRAAPQGHGRRRRTGRAEAARHRQRADGGRAGLRRVARLPLVRRHGQARDDFVRVRPGGRDIRCHVAAARARRYPHHRHRWRRATGRARLGPPVGRVRGRSDSTRRTAWTRGKMPPP